MGGHRADIYVGPEPVWVQLWIVRTSRSMLDGPEVSFHLGQRLARSVASSSARR
jgi:hypothetical protein